MSLHLPSRQACRSTSQILVVRPRSRTSPNLVLSMQQCRNASVFDIFKRKPKPKELATSPSEILAGLARGKAASKQPEGGKLARGSIFGDEEAGERKEEGDSAGEKQKAPTPKDPNAMSLALDPFPKSRRRWQQRKVALQIKRRGRISRTEQLLKTERHHQYASEFFPTSVKKLMPLARQIAGKTVEDALVQLRFSKKKAAVKIAKELVIARDEAIVSAGMGLGHVKKIVVPIKKKSIRADNSGTSAETAIATIDAGEGLTKETTMTSTVTNEGLKENNIKAEQDEEEVLELEEEIRYGRGEEESVQIIEKNGRKRMVKPTAIYIDQAWVNKGKPDKSLEFRARGRTNILLHRHTSISFLLKEEKTRVRRSEEKAEKLAKARPWLHHPDRNIPHQRQYIMW